MISYNLPKKKPRCGHAHGEPIVPGFTKLGNNGHHVFDLG